MARQQVAKATRPGVKRDVSTQALEQVLLKGDLSVLDDAQRLQYYNAVCKSLKLNPYTRPFEYLMLNGQLRLYARKDATDQLRKINAISIEIVDKTFDGDLLTVHVRARDNHGRVDEDYGVLPFKKGGTEFAANAIMKAVTKAKRRVTLSISGLGFLDEAELAGVAPERPPTITDEQQKALRELAREVEADMPSYLDHLSERWELDVVKVADIPASHFDDAIEQLERKREALEKLEANAQLDLDNTEGQP